MINTQYLIPAQNTAPDSYASDTLADGCNKNAQPAKVMPEMEPRRLMDPIPPVSCSSNTLTRSKTMSLISNLTSSFQRSTSSFTLTTSRSMSFSNRQAHSPNKINGSSSYACPSPDDPADPREVSNTMPSSYWTGRYVALHDRFNTEFMNIEVLNIPDNQALSLALAGKESNNEDDMTKESKCASTVRKAAQVDERHLRHKLGTDNAAAGPGSEKTAKRVFVYLNSLCVTEEARKSLWAFQQAYARQIVCAALLPIGGTMVAKEGVLARAGRLFGGGNKSGFGLGRSRRNSVAPLPLGGGDVSAASCSS